MLAVRCWCICTRLGDAGLSPDRCLPDQPVLSPQELLLFLQNLPTALWDDQDVSLLLAEAYRLKFAFADAPNHCKK